jgi:hypothetical protein
LEELSKIGEAVEVEMDVNDDNEVCVVLHF